MDETKKAVVYHRGAQRAWPFLATTYLVFFYGAALAAWDYVIWRNALWGAIAGSVIGLLIAATICSSPIFRAFEDKATSDEQIRAFIITHHDPAIFRRGAAHILRETGVSTELKDRQAFVGVWIVLAAIFGVIGLVVALGRTLLFG